WAWASIHISYAPYHPTLCSKERGFCPPLSILKVDTDGKVVLRPGAARASDDLKVAMQEGGTAVHRATGTDDRALEGYGGRSSRRAALGVSFEVSHTVGVTENGQN